MRVAKNTAVVASDAADTRILRDLRGVGKAIEADLKQLGVRTVAELARSDGQKLYERLNKLTGVRQDPCVLDTFQCAVAQARDPHLPEDKSNWWWWSRERKRALSSV